MTDSDYRLFSNTLDRLMEAGYTQLDLLTAIQKWSAEREAELFHLVGGQG